MPISQAQVEHALGVLEAIAGNRDAGDPMAGEVSTLLADYRRQRASGRPLDIERYAALIIGLCAEYGYPSPLRAE